LPAEKRTKNPFHSSVINIEAGYVASNHSFIDGPVIDPERIIMAGDNRSGHDGYVPESFPVNESFSAPISQEL